MVSVSLSPGETGRHVSRLPEPWPPSQGVLKWSNRLSSLFVKWLQPRTRKSEEIETEERRRAQGAKMPPLPHHVNIHLCIPFLILLFAAPPLASLHPEPHKTEWIATACASRPSSRPLSRQHVCRTVGCSSLLRGPCTTQRLRGGGGDGAGSASAGGQGGPAWSMNLGEEPDAEVKWDDVPDTEV